MTDQDQLPLDLEVATDDNRSTSSAGKESKSEAKRSISYVLGAVLEFGNVTGYGDLLGNVARLHRTTGYSPFNALLMLLQRPGATFVLPAHHWQERYGFVIRRGEQPMVLLQPGGPLMFLLDVSQVEPGRHALPLPADLANPYRMEDVPHFAQSLQWVVENAKFDGVRVTDAPLGLPFAGCVSPTKASATQRVLVRKRPTMVAEDVPVMYDVQLNRSYSDTEKLATLAHELGHVYCGHVGLGRDKHWKDRRELAPDIAELEAESVARVVFGSLAPGVALPDHLGQYFAAEPELQGVSLEAVLKAAGRILDISEGWGPRWKTGAAT